MGGAREITLYRSLPTVRRLDVWPYVLAHGINLAMLVMSCTRLADASSGRADSLLKDGVVSLPRPGDDMHGPAAAAPGGLSGASTSGSAGVELWGYSLPLLHTVLLVVLPGLQLLTWLGTHWSVKFKALVTMQRVSKVEDAVHAMVVPSKVSAQAGLCAIEKVDLRAPDSKVQPVATFEFQKRRYLWEAGEKKWQKVSFPVSETMRLYSSSRGLADDDAVADATARWGLNSFEIPLPTFKDLYAEQCRQPFFVFQVYIYMYVSNIYTYVCVCECVCVCVQMHTYMHTYAHTYKQTYIPIYIDTCMHVHACIHTHTHTHTCR